MRNSKQTNESPFLQPYNFKSVKDYTRDLSSRTQSQELEVSTLIKLSHERSTNIKEIKLPISSSASIAFKTQPRSGSEPFRDLNKKLLPTTGDLQIDSSRPENRCDLSSLLSEAKPFYNQLEMSVRKSERKPSSDQSPENRFRHSISQISLPPIKEKDPFVQKNALDHWNYRPLVAKKSRSIRSNEITDLINSSRTDLSQSRDRFPKIGMNEYLLNKMKNNAQVEEISLFALHMKNGDKKVRSFTQPKERGEPRSGDNSPKTNDVNIIEKDISSINPEREILAILNEAQGSEVIDLEDLPLGKKTCDVEEADEEINYIINSGQFPEAIGTLNAKSNNERDGDRHFKDQARKSISQSSLSNRNLGIKRFRKRDSTRESIPVIRTAISLSARTKEKPKKKEHYNKWFVPVEYWDLIKEPLYKDHKNAELKQNILFIYNNIHNYDKKDYNPLAGKPVKGVQQMRYEAVQEKLKQNPMIERIRRHLSENNFRVPKFLKGMQQEKTPDL